MKRLKDLTYQMQRRDDAAAFFRASIERCLSGDSSSALLTLRSKLDAAHYRDLEHAIATKATVDPTTTFQDTTFTTPYGWAAAFLGLVKALTSIDALNIRQVPFMVNAPIATVTSEHDWVGEGAPAPVTKMTFASAQMTSAKIAGGRAVTKELLRFSNPRVQGIVEDDTARAVAIACDACAFDPTRAAVSDVSPASLTHGATQVMASGSDGAAFEADAAALLAAISTGNPTRPFFVLNRRCAILLASKRLTTGQRAFPKLGLAGGSILGVDVAIGLGVPDVLVAIDADRVLLGGDDSIEIDVSTQTALQMDTAPSSGGQARVSLFQSGLVGVMATRFINWQKASDAVAYRSVSIGGGSPE